MTFENFSMAINYPKRGEQFYDHYESHMALFGIMCQYMDNQKDDLNIKIKESKGGCSYIISSNKGEDLSALGTRITRNKIPSMIEDKVMHAVVTSTKPSELSIQFK